MSPIIRITVATLAAVALAAPVAGARDLRSPDARDAAATHAVKAPDLRSPDARDAGQPTPAPAIDLRSPDARDAALPAPSQPAPSSDGFAWGYLIAGSALLVMLTAGGLTVITRRRVKHSVVTG
jgi:hypothetical protein